MNEPLEDIIREHIKAHGSISIAEFMHLALLHPTHGYYTTRDPFGAAGDFTTAPEISQTFGELVGAWCAAMWQEMGAPEKVALVELGPGRGTLMKDALRATAHVEGFHKALSVHLVEASPKLRERQSHQLSDSHAHISWHDHPSDIPRRIPCLYIANEFFDALPIHQYIYHKGKWVERMVGMDEHKALRFITGKTLPDNAPELPKKAKKGDILEVSPAAQAIVEDIATRIKNNGGAAIFIDYGYRDASLRDTLQAVKQHRHHQLLEKIGEADITAHVDFLALRNVADRIGVSTSKIIPQGEFLARMGIKERYDMLCNTVNSQEEADALFEGVTRLVSPEQMGELFKVLMVWQDGVHNPL
jgi:NADH dehydrogenase [ubiquinone] 1 alpha subcomplex assembly factor 7